MAGLKYIQSGDGPTLVFLHGWGANSAVWQNVVYYFQDKYCVRSLDLPGYGLNYEIPAYEFNHGVALVAEQIPRDAIVIAWSLSGLLATAIAKVDPGRIKQLILVASSPCFVNRHGWTCGVDEMIFHQFSQQLQANHTATLLRFLSLQTRGSSAASTTLKTLRKSCLSGPSPSAKTLQAGLDWLCTQDLRTVLSGLSQPVLTVFGQYDTIVRPELSVPLGDLNAAITSHVIQGAGHAPFISHPAEFCELLDNYLLPEQTWKEKSS